ncbi:hypothetical protein ACQU0X_22120 [Pseudovibrio ascidiaceicola]|uniref:arsenate reductase/protein-tyrosine-phosphatase family protein n=1 Tax=Pseudovibrio ascidiaceicola TaxID=285279 RepID=UPI003D369278
MKRILFVCTGNVFRSMTAEYSLRRQLGLNSQMSVASAGTREDPHLQVREDVADYLATKGLNVNTHRRTLVTADLINQSDFVIAKNTDHKRYLLEQFSVAVPHFMEACGKSTEALPDVDDLFAASDWHGTEALNHIKLTIDRIVEMTPLLLGRFTQERT